MKIDSQPYRPVLTECPTAWPLRFSTDEFGCLWTSSSFVGITLGVVLVGSVDPARLTAWYAEVFGGVPDGIVIDRRDVASSASEPGRVILTFTVDDIAATEARLIDHEVTWVREIESTPLGRIGTVIDADGNYVQVLETTGRT